MRKRHLLGWAVVVTSACADRPSSTPQAEEVALVVIDAAVTVPDAAIAPPLTGMHLDGADDGYRPKQAQSVKPAGKEIELVLRSTPPGAMASIDGKIIGATPTFWRGTVDDRHHEFIFVKEGYSIARYRFVATHSGVVHGTLVPVPDELASDAGVH